MRVPASSSFSVIPLNEKFVTVIQLAFSKLFVAGGSRVRLTVMLESPCMREL